MVPAHGGFGSRSRGLCPLRSGKGGRSVVPLRPPKDAPRLNHSVQPLGASRYAARWERREQAEKGGRSPAEPLGSASGCFAARWERRELRGAATALVCLLPMKCAGSRARDDRRMGANDHHRNPEREQKGTPTNRASSHIWVSYSRSSVMREPQLLDVSPGMIPRSAPRRS